MPFSSERAQESGGNSSRSLSLSDLSVQSALELYILRGIVAVFLVFHLGVSRCKPDHEARKGDGVMYEEKEKARQGEKNRRKKERLAGCLIE